MFVLLLLCYYYICGENDGDRTTEGRTPLMDVDNLYVCANYLPGPPLWSKEMP